MTQDWQERFDRFAARKIRAAGEALLPPYATELEAPGPEHVGIGSAWSRRLFDGPFYVSPGRRPTRPECSLVFVESADGNTGAWDPSTLGGGSTDTHLVYEGLSRVAADAVLAGAQTIRGADLVFSVWHPELVALRESLGLPRHPVQIVATLAGVDLDALLLFNVPELRGIVITIPAAADRMRDALATRPWITPVVMNRPEDLGPAFDRLSELGIRRVSCVGGRQLARRLLETGLVDDLYLTISPRPGGEPDTPLYSAPLGGRVVLRKHGTREESGVVFEHRTDLRCLSR